MHTRSHTCYSIPEGGSVRSSILGPSALNLHKGSTQIFIISTEVCCLYTNFLAIQNIAALIFYLWNKKRASVHPSKRETKSKFIRKTWNINHLVFLLNQIYNNSSILLKHFAMYFDPKLFDPLSMNTWYPYIKRQIICYIFNGNL